MNISPRTKEILKILCGQDAYITIESISQQLDVSSRTVLRELRPVEKWLAANGYALEKKKGTGIMLGVKERDREQIMNLLVAEKTSKAYNPEERRTIILMELLLKQKVLKAMYFNSKFNVTEGTVSSDLDKVEKWLEQQGLKLIRRPGLGAYIAGNEKDIRSAIAELLYEQVTPEQIMDFVRGKEIAFKSQIWRFIDKDIADALKGFLSKAEAALGYQLADDAYSALAIHLAIAFQRMRSNEKVYLDPAVLRELQKSREYSIASKLLGEIASELKLEIPALEIGYIAMYLKGCKGRTALQDGEGFVSEDLRLTMMVKKMIEIAQVETGCYMEENENLLLGLIRHLDTAINRIKMDMNIRNPLLEEIRNHYPELYRTAEKCVAVVEELENIKVPSSEIAYIAIHLGAVMENSRDRNHTYNIAIACTSGIGTSRLLASRLAKEFKNLNIAETVSTIKPDVNVLKARGIDFVVSTIPMPYCELPVVVVNPLLMGGDKRRLEEFIESLEPDISRKTSLPDMSIQIKDRLQLLNICNQKIMEVLDNFEVIEDVAVDDVDMLIAEVSGRLLQDSAARGQLSMDIKKRELQGSMLLEQKGIMLMHCRTNTVNEIHFKVIRLKKPLTAAGSGGREAEITMVALMLAPVEVPKIALKILSEITGALVENDDFVLSVKEDSQDKAYNKLSFILYQFYQSKSINSGI